MSDHSWCLDHAKFVEFARHLVKNEDYNAEALLDYVDSPYKWTSDRVAWLAKRCGECEACIELEPCPAHLCSMCREVVPETFPPIVIPRVNVCEACREERARDLADEAFLEGEAAE